MDDADPDPPQNLSSRKRQKDKHREHRFAEGWVEFMNKKVARSVAEMLNANTIGECFASVCAPVFREWRRTGGNTHLLLSRS